MLIKELKSFPKSALFLFIAGFMQLFSFLNAYSEGNSITDSLYHILGKSRQKAALMNEIAGEVQHISPSEALRVSFKALETSIKEKNKKELSMIEDQIQSLKQKINLRDIAKHHHYDKSKRELINNYSTNFKQTLLSDEKLELIELVQTAKNIQIPELNGIKSNLIKLQRSSNYESDKKMADLNKTLELMQSKILLTDQDIRSTKEKQLRLDEKKKDIKDNILKKSRIIFPNFEIKD